MRIPILLVAFAAACASGTGSGPATSGATAGPRGSANLITQEEIAGGSYQTALDIVQNLRPSMLRGRGVTTGVTGADASGYEGPVAGVVVYLEEVRLGSVESLRSIPAAGVKEIRFVSARDATTRWGTGHPSGAIQVITKKGR